MPNYINATEFFIIIGISVIGWVFACALGLGITLDLVTYFKKWFRLRKFYKTVPQDNFEDLCHCGNMTMHITKPAGYEDYSKGIVMNYCFHCALVRCDIFYNVCSLGVNSNDW